MAESRHGQRGESVTLRVLVLAEPETRWIRVSQSGQFWGYFWLSEIVGPPGIDWAGARKAAQYKEPSGPRCHQC